MSQRNLHADDPLDDFVHRVVTHGIAKVVRPAWKRLFVEIESGTLSP